MTLKHPTWKHKQNGDRKSLLKFTHLEQGDVVVIHRWVVQVVRYDLGHLVHSAALVTSARTGPEAQVRRLQLNCVFAVSVVVIQ